jgi:DNA-binding NarL/FixJ family response regulator
MLSIYPEEQYAIRALKAGAKGYLTKTSVPEELVTAIQEIAGGNRYITRSLSKKLAAELLDPHVGELPHERLTDREFQVMSGLARGETVSDIAGKLGLSVKTISTHRAHLLAKMELDSNAQVMRYALKNGLVE